MHVGKSVDLHGHAESSVMVGSSGIATGRIVGADAVVAAKVLLRHDDGGTPLRHHARVVRNLDGEGAAAAIMVLEVLDDGAVSTNVHIMASLRVGLSSRSIAAMGGTDGSLCTPMKAMSAAGPASVSSW